MKAVHLTARDFVRQPWKNGGGSTTQLAVHGEGDRWLWRVSVADVATSGPFSDFPGYERTIMLLEGDGMELTVDGARTTLDQPFAPFTFDGGASTTCRLLRGPVRDLNVMVDRSRARATVEVIENGTVRIPSQSALVYCLDASARVEPHALAKGELLRIDAANGASLEVAGRVTLIRIDAR